MRREWLSHEHRDVAHDDEQPPEVASLGPGGIYRNRGRDRTSLQQTQGDSFRHPVEPFLDHAFRAVDFRMRVTVHADGTWSYEEHTRLRLTDREGLVDHVDRNTLRRIAEPTPNPLATFHGSSSGA